MDNNNDNGKNDLLKKTDEPANQDDFLLPAEPKVENQLSAKDEQKEAVPEEQVPEEQVPEEQVPEEQVPEETVPEETVPEEKVPEETVPEEKVPEETVPEEEEDQELRELNIIEKNIRSKLINQPQPQSQCQLKTTDNEPYTEKVQLKTELTSTEESISTILKQYSDKIHAFLYFQPVISSESLQIGQINAGNIDKCKDEALAEITDQLNGPSNGTSNSNSIISTKYKKIGSESQTLFSFLRTRSKDIKQKNHFLTLFITSFQQVLDSISKMQSIDTPIVHFNLTEQTILYDNINAVPVISDFRMAFTQTDLENPDKIKTLFPFYNEYSVWPIEIYILSRLFEDESIIIFTSEMADTYVREFTQMLSFTETQISDFENRMKEFMMQFINKPVIEVITAFKSYMNTWDVYSTAIAFYTFLKEFPLCETCAFIQTYINILNKIILSDPSQRPTIQIISERVETTFNQVSKKEYAIFLNTLQEM